MIPWKRIHTAPIPASEALIHLYQRGQEYSIRVGVDELMNSRVHGSETALAQLACSRIANRPSPAILIGGLGMGFTVAAALQQIKKGGRITVAELIPEIEEWNRGILAHLAGNPLKDPRVKVCINDVGRVMKEHPEGYDAILLDVDNGPEAMTHAKNSWLYTLAGLQTAHNALRPEGVLAVWSAGPSLPFTKRLKKTGFRVEETRVNARGEHKGSLHTIWLATRGR